MSQELIAIAVAAITVLGTLLTALISKRAQAKGAEVAEQATLFEGYDELMAHFRRTVQDLQKRNSILEAQVEAMHEEMRVLRDDHAAMWFAIRSAGIDIPDGVTEPRKHRPRFDER